MDPKLLLICPKRGSRVKCAYFFPKQVPEEPKSPPETPLGPRGDQFAASTRPGRAKEGGRDTQSSDCAENRIPDGLPEGIAVTPDLHFMLKML